MPPTANNAYSVWMEITPREDIGADLKAPAGARGGGATRLVKEQPRWVNGLRVALDRYRELDPPVTMAEIRGHRDELLALRQRMQDRAAGQPIYFPWNAG